MCDWQNSQLLYFDEIYFSLWTSWWNSRLIAGIFFMILIIDEMYDIFHNWLKEFAIFFSAIDKYGILFHNSLTKFTINSAIIGQNSWFFFFSLFVIIYEICNFLHGQLMKWNLFFPCVFEKIFIVAKISNFIWQVKDNFFFFFHYQLMKFATFLWNLWMKFTSFFVTIW